MGFDLKGTHMNVVYASNDGYARHLATSMVSLFDRNQEMKEIVIYVLSMGLSQESKDRLSSIAEKYERCLHIIELHDIKSRFDYEIDTRGFDISAMGRLFVGQLLPQQMEKVLYLDCDTVVVQPLGKLWDMDLKGHILGAVMEPTIYEEVKRDIGLTQEEAYFNSGVLLIDLKRWRQKQAEKTAAGFLWRERRKFVCL